MYLNLSAGRLLISHITRHRHVISFVLSSFVCCGCKSLRREDPTLRGRSQICGIILPCQTKHPRLPDKIVPFMFISPTAVSSNRLRFFDQHSEDDPFRQPLISFVNSYYHYKMAEAIAYVCAAYLRKKMSSKWYQYRTEP